jgi:murein DD-endopeptidase MepM/ murein hydrolase activator NlpD
MGGVLFARLSAIGIVLAVICGVYSVIAKDIPFLDLTGAEGSQSESESENKHKGDGTCVIPVKDARLKPGSYWGDSRGDRVHEGLDIHAPVGTTIVATRGGKVIFAGPRGSGWGNIVFIEHSDSSTAVYAHLQKWLVKAGQQVETGQPIGLIGYTGNSDPDWPHLHIEIGKPGNKLGQDQKQINPLPWLQACGGADPKWDMP